MTGLLTGQLNLTQLQNNVWVGILQVMKFIAWHWSLAIEHFINYQIMINIIYLIVLLTIWIISWIILYKNKEWDKDIIIVITVFLCFILIILILAVIYNLLWWIIAPEITFIQYFR